MTSQLSRRQLTWMLFGGSSSLAGAMHNGQDRRLYLLAGGVWPNGDWKFAAVLFRLDEARREVAWAAALIPQPAGLECVVYSFENHVLLVASPQAVMNEWAVVNFARPGSPRAFRIGTGPAGILSPHLVHMDGAVCLTLKLISERERRLVAIRLTDLEIKVVAPQAAYQEFAIDGAVGGLYPRSEFAFLEQPVSARRLVVAEWTPPRFNSPIVLPGDIRFSPDDLISLSAANSSLLVLTSRGTRVWRGEDGFTPVWLLDGSEGTWHSIRVPGGVSRLRAFGSWVNAHVIYNLVDKPKPGQTIIRDGSDPIKPSPGAGLRRQGPGLTGPGFDQYALDQQVYQPGLIWLYHVPTRRRIVEETGQGDTEVLWVEDGHVLYRCDRALYEARIDGTRLRNHRKLIERDFIADVHWVFYGPPSPPPPDPPWAAFKDYEK